jgi:DNA-binding CsgD family transcriptional regulator
LVAASLLVAEPALLLGINRETVGKYVTRAKA